MSRCLDRRRRAHVSVSRSHRLEHVDALFGVALSDLFQRLVLVATLGDVLLVKHVVPRHVRIDLRRRQLGAQRLERR